MQKGKLILKKIIKETSEVNTLCFQVWWNIENAENVEKINFEAGQYLELTLGDVTKPYTISSSPEDKYISITVKKAGNFSNKLFALKVGTEVNYLGPFGFLTLSEIEEKDQKKDLVFIAGGIGITPFFSILNLQEVGLPVKRSSLFYANENKNKTVFYQNLKNIENKEKYFNLYTFYSENNQKLTLNSLQTKLKNFENNNFFICGSIKFVDYFWKELKKIGIKEENIFTEAFF